MVMQFCERVYCALQKVTRIVVEILLSLMVVIVFCNVISRYCLDASLAWSEEISRFMLIWMVFLGAVLAYVNNEHLGLDILVKCLPHTLRYIVFIFADLMVLAALVVMAVGGVEMAVGSWEWTAPASDIPYGYIYIIVPLSCGIMGLQTVFKLIIHFRTLRGVKEDAVCSRHF